jgi:hypothetical protein
VLTDFLRDGPTELPYQSLDAVRDRTEQTGQTRVVIAGSCRPGITSSQDLAEINAIIDSVRIEPQGG